MQLTMRHLSLQVDFEAVFTAYDDMDSVLRDRVGWECPGESTDSGSGSDFTRFGRSCKQPNRHLSTKFYFWLIRSR
ncbi:hypothetical protein WJX82_002110 [Trebouxia sp. C0006]